MQFERMLLWVHVSPPSLLHGWQDNRPQWAPSYHRAPKIAEVNYRVNTYVFFSHWVWFFFAVTLKVWSDIFRMRHWHTKTHTNLKGGLKHVSQLLSQLQMVMCTWAVRLPGHRVSNTHAQEVGLEADCLQRRTKTRWLQSIDSICSQMINPVKKCFYLADEFQ